MLLPTNMVAIKWPDLLVTIRKTPDIKGEDCLSSSSLNLLAEINAISIPEKKAEKTMVISISVNNIWNNLLSDINRPKISCRLNRKGITRRICSLVHFDIYCSFGIFYFIAFHGQIRFKFITEYNLIRSNDFYV